MSESLILLIAVGLLAALVVLLIVIARLLVGVRQALAETRAAEAADQEPVDMAPAETSPMDAAPEPFVMETTTAEPAPLVETRDDSPDFITPTQTVEPIIQPEQEIASEPAVEESAFEPSGGFQTETPEPVVEQEPGSVVAATTGGDPFADTSFAEGASEQVPEPTDPQPYQRDGRWWFERDGELLVYDEVRGEWVPAAAEGSESLEQPVAEPWQPESDQVVAPEAQAWQPDPAEVVPPEAEPSEAEPVATGQEDPFAHPLDEPHPPFEPFEAPRDEAVTPAEEEIVVDEPAEAEPAVAEEPALAEPAPAEEPAQPASYWKCPSCGVVNGSTATSCRMCFTARP